MSFTFDTQEMLTRLVKYLTEGLVVAIVAAVLPSKSLSFEEILLLALTAAAVFALLDLVSPSIGSSARAGVGYGVGFNLVPFV
jgi:ABC-type Co2+ transport system permease subunit